MTLEKKTLNDVPGIPCPECGEGRLRFASLDDFLQAARFNLAPRCDRCGGTAQMDTTAAREVVARLHDVKRTTDEAERLAQGLG